MIVDLKRNKEEALKRNEREKNLQKKKKMEYTHVCVYIYIYIYPTCNFIVINLYFLFINKNWLFY